MKGKQVFRNSLARWATHLVKDVGERTKRLASSVLQQSAEGDRTDKFYKVKRGLESRSIETASATFSGGFRTALTRRTRLESSSLAVCERLLVC